MTCPECNSKNENLEPDFVDEEYDDEEEVTILIETYTCQKCGHIWEEEIIE